MLSVADGAWLQQSWSGYEPKLLQEGDWEKRRGVRIKNCERNETDLESRWEKLRLSWQTIPWHTWHKRQERLYKLTLRAERKCGEESCELADGDLARIKEDGFRGIRWALTLRTYIIKRSKNTSDYKKGYGE